MTFVACSGFPVPVSRYWGEFSGVEIEETELGIPGDGTLRRWVREAPEQFAFTLRAPKVIAESGFAKNDENKELLKQIAEVAKKLDARAVVFSSADWKPTRPHKTALKTFATMIPRGFPVAVFDLPEWDPAAIQACIGKKGIAAYDPLQHETPEISKLAYVRLAGPAGRRSRYDDNAIAKLAEHCQELKADTVICVFCNQDMHVNGKALMKALK